MTLRPPRARRLRRRPRSQRSPLTSCGPTSSAGTPAQTFFFLFFLGRFFLLVHFLRMFCDYFVASFRLPQVPTAVDERASGVGSRMALLLARLDHPRGCRTQSRRVLPKYGVLHRTHSYSRLDLFSSILFTDCGTEWLQSLLRRLRTARKNIQKTGQLPLFRFIVLFFFVSVGFRFSTPYPSSSSHLFGVTFVASRPLCLTSLLFQVQSDGTSTCIAAALYTVGNVPFAVSLIFIFFDIKSMCLRNVQVLSTPQATIDSAQLSFS
jgi:hypothetical protein